MSFFDTAKRVFMGREYDDYDEEYEEYEDDYEEEKPRRGLFSFLTKEDEYDDYEDEAPTRTVPRRASSYQPSNASYSSGRASAPTRSIQKPTPAYARDLTGVEVTLLTPASFDDSIRIVREVKEGKIVIFDVSEIQANDEARRIVDYICGAAEGIDCPFSRLCPSIFCIAPKGVVMNGKKQRY